MKKINLIIPYTIAIAATFMVLVACAMEPLVVKRKVYRLAESVLSKYPGPKGVISITNGDDGIDWHVQLQNELGTMYTNTSYTLKFSAAGLTKNVDNFFVTVNGGPTYSWTQFLGTNLTLAKDKTEYTFTFTVVFTNTISKPLLQFNMGKCPSDSLIVISALSICSNTTDNLINNGSFENGALGWNFGVYGTQTAGFSVEGN